MRRIGLVLGAGGVAGQAYHAGVLSALVDLGWDPRTAEVVVGTSAGSIAAALLRAGVAPSGLVSGRYRTQQGGRQAVPSDAAELGLAAGLPLRAAGSDRVRVGGRLARLIPAGRLSTAGIVSMVSRSAGERWPTETTWVCAVRRRDGRRVVFGRDGSPRAPLPLAVSASCAIPGYFQPVLIEDESYVDGGAHSPTNLDLLAGLGLDAVVVSSPMSVSRGALGPRVDLPLRLLLRATLAGEVARVRRRGTPVLTLQPTSDDLKVMGLNAMDPRPWADVVERAHASTRRRLQDPELHRLLTG